ncbi:MBL fold metallo-hydrolase [Alteromonas halophila]|nr:MBL fold metallo-hydrolase [Alteromonas halophila]
MKFESFTVPQPGCVTQVAEGIFWLRMPLPFALDHINLYLLEDEQGWYIVDCGLATSETRQHWQSVLSTLDKPVLGVIATHMHPDHIGLAGWLTEQHQVPLYMSQTEYFAARALFAGRAGASAWRDEQYFVRCGLATDAVTKAVGDGKGFSRIVSPLPVAYERLTEGQVLTINNNRWTVMIGRGHSPEHVCLYCQERHILVAGDHILPSITPNIGVYSTEPDGNPLADYLDTLLPFMELPSDTLVLPAHNQPFTGVRARVQALRGHHQQQLKTLYDVCRIPMRVTDCLPALFNRQLDSHLLHFAIAECLSHLNYLCAEGQLVRTLSEEGVYIYCQSPASETEQNDSVLSFDMVNG